MKRVTNSMMVISLIIFLVAGGALLVRSAQDKRDADAFTALSNQAHQAAAAAELAQETETSRLPATNAAPAADGMLLFYRETAQQQQDLVGWLRIEGTKLDYPVMRSPQEPERYLHLSFDGRYSRAGTPFMLPSSDPSVPNNNIIIYGHHMKDGSMFGTLANYEKQAYWEEHPLIRFDTLAQAGTYRIVAVFRTSMGAEDGFAYYDYEWLDDKATFDRYMRGVMANRLYDTGETASYGDELLSLSTCDYHAPDGRLVVVAKKVEQIEGNNNE